MKCSKEELLLYAVTDRSWLGESTLYQQVRDALEGGATFIQLREEPGDRGVYGGSQRDQRTL